MKKIKNIILFLFPILFFSLLTIYLIQCQQISQIKQKQDLQAKLDSVKMSQVYGYLLNYGNNIIVPLNQEMIVTDSNNRRFKLEQLIKTRKFIFHFDETNCFVCIEKYLPFLKKLSARIGKEQVMILGSFEKSQNLFLTLQGYDVQSIPVYNLKPSYLRNTRVGSLNMPYIFEVDSLLQTTRFFIPEKTWPNLSAMYNSNIPILNN
jgi:hypothetical protein